MTVSDIVRESRPCFDPECSGTAVPEQEWDLVYLACEECGSEFGHMRVSAEPDCSRGVPEAVRRAASGVAPVVSLGMPRVGE